MTNSRVLTDTRRYPSALGFDASKNLLIVYSETDATKNALTFFQLWLYMYMRKHIQRTELYLSHVKTTPVY